MKVKGYAAFAPGGELQPHEYELGELGPNDIEIAVTHCGICHSDLHLVDNDWHISSYPMVPGHEAVGTVRQVGSAVNHLAVGQRVGIGWQSGSCSTCEWCVSGDENLCAKNEATCVGRPGGFADTLRANARFAFPLPDGLASENAAPLLCGGITVYTPLRYLGITPASRVAVLGIGGLGHLALQFANAFGCEVTALTSTMAKADEARGFGARHVLNSRDPGLFQQAAGSFDFILSTINAPFDWASTLNLLRPKGTLCIVGATPEPMVIPAMSLILGQRQICGSPIGNRSAIAEMLQFAARHGITAQTEVLPMSEVNTALSRLRKNQVRYRFVLKA